MKTVIYLDELLLTNFLAAAALLLGAGLLCARQCSGLRLMAGSAAAAAAYRLGLTDPKMVVQMPGGTLEIEIDEQGVVHMTGDVGYVGTMKLGNHFTEQLRALK